MIDVAFGLSFNLRILYENTVDFFSILEKIVKQIVSGTFKVE